jgi:NAD(P)-dependent dehydrogenase (short-subunit alcohol dehydrogenase family)
MNEITMFATIKREFGHLDGVFVNAGYSEFLLFEEVTEQSFDKVIAVNFKGAYFTIQSLAATEARLVGNHQCVRWRAQGVADNLDRPAVQAQTLS